MCSTNLRNGASILGGAAESNHAVNDSRQGLALEVFWLLNSDRSARVENKAGKHLVHPGRQRYWLGHV